MFVGKFHFESKSKLLDKMKMTRLHARSYVTEHTQEQPDIFTSKMAALNIFLLICIFNVVLFF